ncbi:uncharacterized protein LOC133307093 [Gastrolobium bilobum]|uniref:uncharacterized protein LOC133307093 n=1 Tax=Gastrolobium bilobum TaxID=150636 RepID=UPI002AB1E9AE|nr:uncharacterized protein LOC133307093 [Gastrolobium bilobum]
MENRLSTLEEKLTLWFTNSEERSRRLQEGIEHRFRQSKSVQEDLRRIINGMILDRGRTGDNGGLGGSNGESNGTNGGPTGNGGSIGAGGPNGGGCAGSADGGIVGGNTGNNENFVRKLELPLLCQVE